MVLALGFAGFTATGNGQAVLFVVVATCLAAATLGWLEDLRGLTVTVRAGSQLLIGVVAASAAALNTGHSAWWGFVGGIALIGGINVVNFMDGVNTISALHGIIAGLSFVAIGILEDSNWLVTSGSILAAAFAAFLPWNLSGRIFLGDVGSYLLGGTIAIVVTIGWMQGLSIIALAAPMTIYVADTAVTLISRIRSGERWHEAHRDHTYQRLNKSGLKHPVVASIVAILSMATAALGLGASETVGVARLGLLGTMALLVLGYTAARFLLGSTGTVVATESNSV